MQQYGCPSCHVIPGVRGASGHVGPPLTEIALRTYLAGRILNTPEGLMRWVMHPRSVDEKTAMPEMNVSERDAADIASFLLTLK